jgi:L-histidine Nalpha-methyltransferase / hercynylcysteine S-oxide synthase
MHPCAKKLQLSDASALTLFTASSLRALISLSSSTSNLTLHILERPPFTFPSLSTTTNPYNIPTAAEFTLLWRAWDLITLGMIPPSLLHTKPIDLRHKPLFYIGHLPTFNAHLLSAHLRVPFSSLSRPHAHFATLFERGIDPVVDDPELCHSHSEVPERDEDWPALGEVLAFRDAIRAKVLKTLEEVRSGERALTARLVRTLVMMHEHEGFHIEVSSLCLQQLALVLTHKFADTAVHAHSASGQRDAPPARVCNPALDTSRRAMGCNSAAYNADSHARPIDAHARPR